MEDQTAGYRLIEDYDIGPRFLGYPLEDGRVIGFLMERIANARHAGPQDLDIFQQTLAQLHALGIKHGDVNRFNFLIRDSRAILSDFDTTRKRDDSNLPSDQLLEVHSCAFSFNPGVGC
ncbi:hypothetical protein N7455_010847 [Penicillium solitum]|uniref:uncharacterized protein n=1 Tax=Penicillium solitum TaxID=60172 RepID=UPI0017CCD928|nr:hypothetical protein HAV15_000929 [Penicillium sp. str. \